MPHGDRSASTQDRVGCRLGKQSLRGIGPAREGTTAAARNLRRRRLAQQGEDERAGEAGRRDQGREAPDNGMGERPPVTAADARTPGGAGSHEGDGREDDAEDDRTGSQQWDLRRVPDRDCVGEVQQRRDHGDRDQDTRDCHRDRADPATRRLRLGFCRCRAAPGWLRVLDAHQGGG